MTQEYFEKKNHESKVPGLPTKTQVEALQVTTGESVSCRIFQGKNCEFTAQDIF